MMGWEYRVFSVFYQSNPCFLPIHLFNCFPRSEQVGSIYAPIHTLRAKVEPVTSLSISLG
uniref:Uncharacterized protein n=1 Tax=Picea glauca TaxID=3330 RepID=A0A101M2W4_PICGL|nr:hypothetical protein ABT39_MTgene3279 [Picea glauca]